MALLLVLCLLDRGPSTSTDPPSWAVFRWLYLLKRVWGALDVRVIAIGGALFVGMVLLSLLLFVLMPRFNLDQAIPFLDISGQPRSGFSEDVQLNSVTEIREDGSVALRIDVPSLEAIDGTPYWRILALDHYGMDASGVESLNRKGYMLGERRRVIDGWRSPIDRTGTVWTFYLEGGIGQYLPVPGVDEMRFQTLQDVRFGSLKSRQHLMASIASSKVSLHTS